MPIQTVELADEQAEFIRQSVHEGRYVNASDVVRAGLRLLELHDQNNKLKLDALSRLATEAFDQIDRGECETVDSATVDSAALDLFLDKVAVKSVAPR